MPSALGTNDSYIFIPGQNAASNPVKKIQCVATQRGWSPPCGDSLDRRGAAQNVVSIHPTHTAALLSFLRGFQLGVGGGSAVSSHTVTTNTSQMDQINTETTECFLFLCWGYDQKHSRLQTPSFSLSPTTVLSKSTGSSWWHLWRSPSPPPPMYPEAASCFTWQWRGASRLTHHSICHHSRRRGCGVGHDRWCLKWHTQKPDHFKIRAKTQAL